MMYRGNSLPMGDLSLDAWESLPSLRTGQERIQPDRK